MIWLLDNGIWLDEYVDIILRVAGQVSYDFRFENIEYKENNSYPNLCLFGPYSCCLRQVLKVELSSFLTNSMCVKKCIANFKIPSVKFDCRNDIFSFIIFNWNWNFHVSRRLASSSECGR